ncbi:MAG: TetR/AcrR family transcriptional regulator [Actinomycetaceae bacterium]|nr:TetR/AcrR family transcriptional regulator [Actinomycetaceae bacterium]
MTKSSGGRPRKDEGRDLRSTLLAHARELLDEGGPAALSMREVARRTGCSHQAPYHWFRNREAILAALIEEGFRELQAKMAAAHALVETRGVEAALEASGLTYVEFALSRPGVFRIMFRPDMCDPADYPELRQAAIDARNELTQLGKIADGGQVNEGKELLYWSLVHGLSCLFLDGSLGSDSECEQDPLELAREVISMSVRL